MKGVYELGRPTASQIPSPLSYLLLHCVFVLVFLGQLQVWGVPFHDPPHLGLWPQALLLKDCRPCVELWSAGLAGKAGG